MWENISFEDLKDLIVEEDPDAEHVAEQKSSYRNYSKSIALTIGFLIGVRHDTLIKHLEDEAEYTVIREKLEKDENCCAIRHLNNIRSNLILHFKSVSRALRDFSVDYKPIDKMELFEEDFRYLRRAEISVISGHRDINEYIKNINNEIVKRIDKIQKYFPDWVKFKNIRSLFVMPANIEEESKKFQLNQAVYPYQRYIYWRDPEACGYILCTDKDILEIAYLNNREYFQDQSKVVDASDATKNNISEFLQRGKKIQIFVDGENADPYLFASTVDGLSDYDIDKIDKIVIYYDAVHTTKAWTYLKHFIPDIEIEAVPVERIAEDKSLVDHKLVAGVSKAVYRDGADSIILASSDSDFWSVIDSVDDAKFIVMAERDKCGYSFKNLLRENDIFYCFLDTFKTMENNSFFKGVFRSELETVLKNNFNLGSAKELFDDVIRKSRAEISPAEKEIFYNKYIKGLKLKIDAEGNFKIEIPD
ncbi:MAG: hypothetical protein IKY78_01500 [Clostridia bacterium]|nr:hypothetical protein [Clostridia bacterium]